MVSLAEDHSFGCLDLALPEVTCQSVAASLAAVVASTGQSIHRVWAFRKKRWLCPSKLEETMSPPHLRERASLACPTQEGS